METDQGTINFTEPTLVPGESLRYYPTSNLVNEDWPQDSPAANPLYLETDLGMSYPMCYLVHEE
jgi:hypothetical protein